MKPQIEELEMRDCPSGVPGFMMAQTQTVYPTPPPDKAIFAVQDYINLAPLIPGAGMFRSTPLTPVPVWTLRSPSDYFSSLGDVFQVPGSLEPGEGKYFLVDRQEWLNLQHDIYGFEQPIPQQWANWVQDRQQEVMESNLKLLPVDDPLTYDWTHDLGLALIQIERMKTQ